MKDMVFSIPENGAQMYIDSIVILKGTKMLRMSINL